MNVLAVENLAKSYGGVQALRGVSFQVAAGEMVALIGPNGAGKTTCFNLLNGQLAPDAGRILLNGVDIAGLRPRDIWRLGVSRTFQIAATFGSMPVRENVQVVLLSRERGLWSPAGAAARRHTAEADALLARVGMLDQAARPCSVLAYGDLKRVELAMALAGRPRVLLLDEPTAGMAHRERESLMRLTAELARAGGIAVLFTEHDMDIVFAHAERVIVVADGERIAEGPPAAVRADAHVQDLYLGSGRA